MINFLTDVMDAIAGKSSQVEYQPEFFSGLSRDMFIIANIMNPRGKSGNVLLAPYADLVMDIARTSEDDYVRRVVIPVMEKSMPYCSNPVEFLVRHYGDSVSARRIVGYYRPFKNK